MSASWVFTGEPTYQASGQSITLLNQDDGDSLRAIQGGDFLIAGIHVDQGRGQTPTPPSGWTEMGHSTNGSVWVYYKFATNSEPANWTWTNIAVSSGLQIGYVVAYKGIDRTTPLDTTPSVIGALNTNTWQYGAIARTRRALGLTVFAHEGLSSDITYRTSTTARGGALNSGANYDSLWFRESAIGTGTIASESPTGMTYQNFGSVSVGLREAVNSQGVV